MSEEEKKQAPAGAGGGGKSGGGTPRAAVEAQDSLRSKAYARVLDLTSEGEIVGLVDGFKSIYLDDTPVQNPDGTFNFQGVSYVERFGTQAQGFIQGFPSSEAVRGDINQIEVKNGAPGPITRTVNNNLATYVLVTIGVPSLFAQDVTNGDIHGYYVGYKIELQSNGGGFNSVISRPSWLLGSIQPQYATVIATTSFRGRVKWTPPLIGSNSYNVAATVQYRALGSGGAWTTLLTIDKTQWGGSYGSREHTFAFEASNLANSQYEIQIIATNVDGDVSFDSVEYLSSAPDGIIVGKTTTRYQRTHRIQLTGSPPYDIRVTRISPDAPDSSIQNQTYWDMMVEGVDQKLTYPNSAIIGISIDAEQFSQIPKRSYLIKGLLVKVPSNYNAETREYTGNWDGTFQTAWTNNPAWCWYDMVTNTRYGLGEFIDADKVDKWTLYQIGQYCDEMVPDGFGGEEPRFTCNLYIQAQEEAINVIQTMASIFRGMVYWAGGQLVPTQDAPGTAAHLFTQANVKDGLFNYASSSKKQRHTVALVSWNDPSDHYHQKVEYVEDREGIVKYGVSETQVPAIGCTSRGQAHRVGKWLLFTERLETETVTFQTALDGYSVRPGHLFKVADSFRAGIRFGGRVASASTTPTITLDKPITIESGKSYTIDVKLPNGTIEQSIITSVPGTYTEISLNTLFSPLPEKHAHYVITASDLSPQTFRCLGAAVKDDTWVEVTGLETNASKYDAIEFDLKLEVLPISVLKTTPNPPTNLVLTDFIRVGGSGDIITVLHASWTPPVDSMVTSYFVEYKQGDGNWQTAPHPMVSSNAVELPGVADGQTYSVRITSVNFGGIKSKQYLEGSREVVGKKAPPAAVTGFAYTPQLNGILLTWDEVADLDLDVYEIRIGATWEDGSGNVVFTGRVTNHLHKFLVSGTTKFWIKAIDTSGNYSTSATSLDVVVNAPNAPTGFSHFFSGPDVVFSWTAPAVQPQPIEEYEIRYGTDFDNGTSIGKVKGNKFTLTVNWSGSRTFWIAAYDSVGNLGTASAFTIVNPTIYNAPVIDASIIALKLSLTWDTPTGGSLPIQHYDIRRESAPVAWDFTKATLNPESGSLVPTFNRALATATRVNAAGLIETVAADTPRFDFDPITLACRGLLIEEARTNAFLRTEELDNASWSKAGATITANATTAPDGTSGMDKIVEDGTTGNHYVAQAISVTSGTNYCLSFFVKAAERTRVQFFGDSIRFNKNAIFNISNGTVVGTPGWERYGVESYGNGIYRIWVSGTAIATGSGSIFLFLDNGTTNSYTGSIGSGAYAWGAQHEVGYGPSSYIKTTTAATLRNSDDLTVSDISSFFNSIEGSMYVEGSVRNDLNSPNTLVKFYSNSNSEEKIMIVPRTDSDDIQFHVNASGSLQVNIVSGALVPGSIFRVAAAYKLNDFAASKDGAAAVADASGSIPAGIDRLEFKQSTNQHLNGHLRRFAYYGSRLSNQTLQTITTAGSTYSIADPVALINANNHRAPIDWTGYKEYLVAAVDSAGNYGSEGSVVSLISTAEAPIVSSAFANINATVTWTPPAASLPIAEYEIRYGSSTATWDTGSTVFGRVKGSTLTTKVDWVGERKFLVAAIDENGNEGAAGETSLTVVKPIVSDITVEVIDNNVLLKWDETAQTLPIDRYEIRRGATFAGATVIGTVSARFTLIFETAGGSYTYWVVGIDSAGNYGTEASITAQVNQPPDFVLFNNFASTYAGTKTMGWVEPETGHLIVNVDPNETIQDHFDDRGWVGPQDQIDDGYPLVLVGQTTGNYQETIDYGLSVPSTKITMTPGYTAISGSMTKVPTISYSADNVLYEDFVGVSTLFASAFRYVKYNLAFSAAHDGTGLATDTSVLLSVDSLNYVLDLKLKTFQGEVEIDYTDADITFTRTGTATRVNELGFIESVAVNTPRFDYDPTTKLCRGLLVEGSRTNLCLQSNAFTTTWTQSNAPTVVQNVIGPDGVANSAWTITDDSASLYESVQQNFTVANDSLTHVFSLYVKKTTVATNTLGINFTLSGGTGVSTNARLNTNTGVITGTGVRAQSRGDWWRVSCTVTNNTTGNTSLTLNIYPATGTNSGNNPGSDNAATTGSHVIWGAQVEKASILSSYIPTTTGSVTRGADLASITSIGGFFNSVEGTIYGEAEAGLHDASQGTHYIVSISDGTANERYSVYRSAATTMAGLVVDGAATQVNSGNVSSVADEEVVKTVLGYKANDFAVATDGGAAATDVSGTLPTVNRIEIGMSGGASQWWFGHIRRIIYYNTRLTNTQIENLSGGIPIEGEKIGWDFTEDDSLEPDGKIVDISEGDFLDVQSIAIDPKSTTPQYAAFIFHDTPSPMEFTAYLFDKDGNRISGNATYVIRGV